MGGRATQNADTARAHAARRRPRRWLHAEVPERPAMVSNCKRRAARASFCGEAARARHHAALPEPLVDQLALRARRASRGRHDRDRHDRRRAVGHDDAEARVSLKGRDRSIYMTFAMCTEEDDVVDAYNKAIDPIWGCDISDDYESEKKEVERHGNKLSVNKWLAKIVLGGYMPKYDNMDEPKKLCCTVQ